MFGQGTFDLFSQTILPEIYQNSNQEPWNRIPGLHPILNRLVSAVTPVPDGIDSDTILEKYSPPKARPLLELDLANRSTNLRFLVIGSDADNWGSASSSETTRDRVIASATGFAIMAARRNVQEARPGDLKSMPDENVPLNQLICGDSETPDVDTIRNERSFLFPNIVFASNAFSSLRSLTEPRPGDIGKWLMKDLSILDRYAVGIWNTSDDHGVRSKMLSGYGVDASIESGNTHKSKSAMNRRTFTFFDHDITCEWHTKMIYNTNRIHFYVDVTNSRVLVGTIVDHLPT